MFNVFYDVIHKFLFNVKKLSYNGKDISTNCVVQFESDLYHGYCYENIYQATGFIDMNLMLVLQFN